MAEMNNRHWNALRDYFWSQEQDRVFIDISNAAKQGTSTWGDGTAKDLVELGLLEGGPTVGRDGAGYRITVQGKTAYLDRR